MDTNLWKVDYNNYEEQIINFIKTYHNKELFLLDTCKPNFDLMEKVVYDIAMFHFEKLNIIFDSNEYYIEFWFKNIIFKNNNDSTKNINTFHYDCDENERCINNKQYKPLMSCVNYFNDNDFSLLLTEIDLEEYKFKKFDNKNNLKIIFPKKNKQITFDGTKYHGVIDIFNKLNDNDNDVERYMLAINLWNKKPLNSEYYTPLNIYNGTLLSVPQDVKGQPLPINQLKGNPSQEDCSISNVHQCKNSSENENIFSKEDKLVTIEANNVIKEIELEKNILDFDFYEKMLYDTNNFMISQEIAELVRNEIDKNEFNNFKISYKKPEKSLTEKESKFSSMVKDINIINTFDKNKKEQTDILYNRFIQRFIYNKIFSKNVCEWIIFESENYAKNNESGWTTRRHENYPTTDIPIEKIQNVFTFVLNSFNDIFNKIKKSYCFTDDVLFNINDLFIVKYDEATQNKLDLHQDGSFLSINILLSDPKDFEGGGTYFNDGLTSFLEQGDLLVHSGKVEHSGLTVTKGTRYIMVAFVNIEVKLNNI
jgi:hypothetical protein